MSGFLLGYSFAMLSVDEEEGYRKAQKEIKALLETKPSCERLRKELERWVKVDKKE